MTKPNISPQRQKLFEDFYEMHANGKSYEALSDEFNYDIAYIKQAIGLVRKNKLTTILLPFA